MSTLQLSAYVGVMVVCKLIDKDKYNMKKWVIIFFTLCVSCSEEQKYESSLEGTWDTDKVLKVESIHSVISVDSLSEIYPYYLSPEFQITLNINKQYDLKTTYNESVQGSYKIVSDTLQLFYKEKPLIYVQIIKHEEDVLVLNILNARIIESKGDSLSIWSTENFKVQLSRREQ